MKAFAIGVGLISWLLATNVHAYDMDNHICIAAGYYEGEGNQFMLEIAQRVIAKNRLDSGNRCSEASKRGYDVARKHNAPGKVVSADDQHVIDAATHFGNSVYDAILSRIKFD